MKNNTFIAIEKMNFLTVEEERKRLTLYCQSLPANATLILDLSAVVDCDSAGLAFLIEAKRIAKKYGKKFGIQGLNKTIYALAAFSGVDGILELGTIKTFASLQ